MVTKTIECYDIVVKLLIRKDHWDTQYPDGTKTPMTPKEIADRIQCGIEVPIEEINVQIGK